MRGFWRQLAGKPARVLALSGLVFLGLLGTLFWMGRRDEEPLRIACAAGLREPMMEAARRFEKKTGIPVEMQFGGSGELAGQLELLQADLYFPADESYLIPFREAGQLASVHEVATLRAGLVVEDGNPRGLEDLDDLARPGVRLSLADRSSAIGKLVWRFLEESGRVDRIQMNVVVTKPTVNGVVEDVAVGAVEATLAWEVVASNYKGVTWLPVAGLSEERKVAALAVLASSQRPADALRFARFAVDPQKGGRIFADLGFPPVSPGP